MVESAQASPSLTLRVSMTGSYMTVRDYERVSQEGGWG